ncbi:MAG: dihydrodipicolinate synthase family protein [Gaiellales bacterium]
MPRADTWRGIFPAICTPFTPDDAVDYEAQRRVVRFVLDGGAHGIVAFGLAGEVLRLTADERRELTNVIIDETAGAAPVFVGAGAPSVSASIVLAQHAERAGADCIVLPAPVSPGLSQDALVDYFVRVAAAVSTPVMIQDAPAYLGVGLGPDLVARVAERAGNVRHVKLEAGPAEMSGWLDRLGADLAIWGGDGGVYLLDCIRTGATGIIPGADLVDRLVAVYEAEAAADSAQANSLFADLLPMLVFEMQHSVEHYNACAKLVLRRRGVLEHTLLRAPATPLPEASRGLLERHLLALGFPAEEPITSA